MESKTLSLFGLSFLALIFLVGFASAVITLDPTTQFSNIDEGDSSSFTFTIYNDGGVLGTQAVENITVVPSDLTYGTNTIAASQVSVSGIPTSVQPNSTSSAITVTISVPAGQELGEYTGTITVDGIHNDTQASIADKTITLSVNVTSDHPRQVQSCEATGNLGILDVREIEIKNNGFSHVEFGKDDEWFILDEFEVEIRIENDGDYDVDDIVVEWGIYDLDRGEWLVELEEEDEINLKNGKEETFTVSFKLDDDLDIDLEDFVDDTDNYRFYVRAEGVIDDSDSLNDGEDTCVTEYESATMVIENDFVVLDNIRIPETSECGETIEIFVDVWNIGDDNQDEVSLYIVNKDLDLRESIEVGDIDTFEKEEASFTFTIPRGAEEKTYALIFEVYDEDEDVYENDFDDDLSEYMIPLTVEGKCAAEVAAISATLESVAQAGQPLVVKAIITNNDNDLKTYTINAADFTEFAESVSIDKTILVLDDGESAEVIFTFDTLKKAAGDYTFYIETAADGEVQRQAVSVSLEPRSGFGVTEGASLPWVIGFLNVVLIVIIIIVAVKVAKR